MIYSQLYFSKITPAGIDKTMIGKLLPQFSLKILEKGAICYILKFKESAELYYIGQREEYRKRLKNWFGCNDINEEELDLLIKNNEIALFDANFEYFIQKLIKNEQFSYYLRHYKQENMLIKIFGRVNYYTLCFLR
ncbi:hypothetical protein Mgra_00008695, partial [Meloidogyne graminicola]